MPLVFVPTPLGNLRDITERARDALQNCALLIAEDSRVARKLLTALELPGKEIWTYHEHNARRVTPAILERARTECVCVVTDAGTPGISDPGSELIAYARDEGIGVELLPGPSALIAAAVLSGFPLRRFLFEGFAPRTSAQRRRALAQAFALGMTSVWFESPQRVRDFLIDVESVDVNARVFLLREYTKRFEEQLLGTASQVAARLSDPVRGEIAIAIAPSVVSKPPPSDAQPEALEREIDALLDEGVSVSAVAKALCERGFGERRHVYAAAAARKRSRKERPTNER